jgi:hypothetical protein
MDPVSALLAGYLQAAGDAVSVRINDALDA